MMPALVPKPTMAAMAIKACRPAPAARSAAGIGQAAPVCQQQERHPDARAAQVRDGEVLEHRAAGCGSWRATKMVPAGSSVMSSQKVRKLRTVRAVSTPRERARSRRSAHRRRRAPWTGQIAEREDQGGDPGDGQRHQEKACQRVDTQAEARPPVNADPDARGSEHDDRPAAPRAKTPAAWATNPARAGSGGRQHAARGDRQRAPATASTEGGTHALDPGLSVRGGAGGSGSESSSSRALVSVRLARMIWRATSSSSKISGSRTA